LADIGKINAVALANIAKVDAVAAAAIAKINGLVFTTAAGAFLLDTYTGAAAGYSTRRLATSATNLMRIREDAGDTETDIGYDSNNELDTAAIATHCGTANGYVVTWYDQSGNSNNATQATDASQPQIYDGTAVITKNGKPALTPANNGDNFERVATGVTGQYAFGVVETTDALNSIMLSGSGDQNIYVLAAVNGATFAASDTTRAATYYKNGSSYSPSNSDAVNTDLQSQTLMALSYTSFDNHLIGYPWSGSRAMMISQEIIIYNSDQSSNRTGIETDINSEYLIYQPTDAPTSGLLADYTGAAAAYSVRQLSDKAVIALRVRRDSDDEETNIGWDANGDLDSQAISDFCSTANGYVTRWWDQSTNGNHADQATDASQPQIYNGSAVITENGKPALEFNQDGFAPITGSKSDILFHTSTQGMLYNVGNYTASQNQLRIIAETNGTSSSKSGFVFGYDDRAATGGNDYGYYSLTKGSGSANAITGTQEASFVGAQYLMAIHYDFASRISQYQNGSLLDSITGSKAYGTGDATNDLAIGNIAGNYTYSLVGKMQELVLYNEDDTNRTGIETNINTYFSIYT